MASKNVEFVIVTENDSMGTEPEAVLVSLRTPKGIGRTPSDICCVIDTSGSMGVNASVKGSQESDSLSVMDITKHAVMTVLNTLNEKDRLSIVLFSSNAELKLPLTYMDAAGQEEARKVVASIRAGGCTAMIDGLQKGLASLEAGGDPNRIAHLMLLTDGEPTGGPEPVVDGLTRYLQKHEQFPSTISTFGFGNNACSELLADIAVMGSGTFGFIPDAGFVGTVFVNALSNMLSTFAKRARLCLEAAQNTQIVRASGGWKMNKSGDFMTVDLGLLSYDQSRDVVIYVSAQPGAERPYLLASLECHDGETALCFESKAQDWSYARECVLKDAMAWSREVNRASFVEVLFNSTQKLAACATDNDMTAMLRKCSEELVEFAGRAQSSASANTPEMQGLLEDCLGQALLAISKREFWASWGKHYIRSLSFAHKLQQCNNFKDPGVQHYGGDLFKDLQDTADEIFNKLPPPSKDRDRAASGNISNSVPVVNMANFNDRYAGCIDGSSLICLPSGLHRRVSELVKGDKVLDGEGREAEVSCVVEVLCNDGVVALVEVSPNLRLTAYHPMFSAGSWCFPSSLHVPSLCARASVYNLVLDGAPSVLIDDIPVVVLGHHLTEGAAAHEYFGTDRVIKDLKKLSGYAAGRVVLKPDWALRDPISGLVTGMAEA